MGLVPASCRLLIMTHKKVQFQGPVLTLGNQDLWASYEQLKSFFQEMDCPYAPAQIVPHTSRLFQIHPGLKERARDYVHASTFFQMLGIAEYWDMDKFDRDGPRILHDLNVPVDAEWHDRFNLIVDGGTVEHVFDVRRSMENIIRMCRGSGWIVHLAPASNFMDHGFYSFSPVFFYDWYGANGFGDFICYVWQVDPDPMRYVEPCPYFEYRYGMSFDQLLDPHKQTLIFFAARKRVNVSSLTLPTQGCYDPARLGNALPAATPVPVREARFKVLWKVLVPVLRPVKRKLWPKYRGLKRI